MSSGGFCGSVKNVAPTTIRTVNLATGSDIEINLGMAENATAAVARDHGMIDLYDLCWLLRCHGDRSHSLGTSQGEDRATVD